MRPTSRLTCPRSDGKGAKKLRGLEVYSGLGALQSLLKQRLIYRLGERLVLGCILGLGFGVLGMRGLGLGYLVSRSVKFRVEGVVEGFGGLDPKRPSADPWPTFWNGGA